MEDKLYLTPEEFLRTIKKLEQDNLDLIEDNRKLQAEYRKLKAEVEASSQGTSISGNPDLLRRLSNLEKIVYGKE